MCERTADSLAELVDSILEPGARAGALGEGR